MRRVALWRMRRALVLVCSAFVVVSMFLFLSVQVSDVRNGAAELINGRSDASALELPLVLFVVGAVGLLAALGWRPGGE